MEIESYEQLIRLPEGTKVRIKQEVKCAKIFKTEGTVSIQERTDDTGEYCYGIKIPNHGVCYYFHFSDYEIINT